MYIGITNNLLMGLLRMGCDVGFGSKYANDPREYGSWESYLDIPSFLPDSIISYQTNGYSYTLLA